MVDLIGRQTLRTAVTVEHKAICCPYSERASTIADIIQVRGKEEGRTLKRRTHTKCYGWTFSLFHIPSVMDGPLVYFGLFVVRVVFLFYFFVCYDLIFVAACEYI